MPNALIYKEPSSRPKSWHGACFILTEFNSNFSTNTEVVIMQKFRTQTQQGFTLIELMIVVAIIGILAAVAVPAYQDYIGRSQVSEAMTLTGGAKTAVAEFWSNNGAMPADNAAAGIAASGDINGKYVASVAIANTGVITATMQNTGVSSGLGGTTLLLSPVTSAGTISWTCTGGTIPAKFRPSSCR
jgi:type IV pilus assembly protein PilA